MNGAQHFDQTALEDALNQLAESRTFLIELHPATFLALVAQWEDRTKMEGVQSLMDQGVRFSDLPQIHFVHDGEGTASVIGHEGRHRARALLRAGADRIPVVLAHVYDPNGQAIEWGVVREKFVDEWPRVLYQEHAKSIREEGLAGSDVIHFIEFPVPDPRKLGPDEAIDRDASGIMPQQIRIERKAKSQDYRRDDGTDVDELFRALVGDDNLEPDSNEGARLPGPA